MEESSDYMRSMDSGSVDIIVTSPAYNIGKDYGRGSKADKKAEEDYLNWTYKWVESAKLVLSEKGSLFLNVGDIPSKPLFSFEVAKMASYHFKIQNIIHWIKSVAIKHGDGLKTYGHFKPINSKRYLNSCHEYIFHLTHKGETEIDRLAVGTPYQDKTNIKRWNTGNIDKRCSGNVWHIPYETVTSTKGHPAIFPTELVKRCLLLHGTDKIKVVLDPFVGSGSAAEATNNLLDDFKFIGLDQSSDYISRCRDNFSSKFIPRVDITALSSVIRRLTDETE